MVSMKKEINRDFKRGDLIEKLIYQIYVVAKI